MKKVTNAIVMLIFFTTYSMAQNAGVKTNFVHWATGGTINGGIEFALNDKSTIEAGLGINPFTFSDNRKFQHWIIQPEYRYWTCEKFNGHFFGLHALAAEFNVGGLDIPLGRLKDIKDHRYEGFAFGGGLSYGYQLPLNNRLNLEFNLGAGYAMLLYDKFKCVKCGEKLEEDVKENYFGITKAAVSLIYLF